MGGHSNRNGVVSVAGFCSKGSINSIIESIGFSPNQVHTVHTFDSKKIDVLGFKIFSKEVIFILTRNNRKITVKDISKAKKLIDWQFEYDSLNVEEILDEGIEAQNLSLDFLKTVLDLEEEDPNLFKSGRYDLYFQFKDNILQAFSSSEWENSSSKWLKELNSSMYSEMVKEAKSYHDNIIDAMEEVNSQSSSLLDIPQAITNEFISLHKKSNGNINFYNLLITHYSKACELNEFILMNKGRYTKIHELEYEVGSFIFEFNDSNELVTVSAS